MKNLYSSAVIPLCKTTKTFLFRDITGKKGEWVGTIEDRAQAIRSEFYQKRAELEKAVKENIHGFTMSEKPITSEGGWLWGAIKGAIGSEKKTSKIVSLLSHNEYRIDGKVQTKKFNVDRFPPGVKVRVDADGWFRAKFPNGKLHEVFLYDATAKSEAERTKEEMDTLKKSFEESKKDQSKMYICN